MGLRMRPQSSTAMWRRMVTLPVSMSTSTTDTWAPNGKVELVPSKSPSKRSGDASIPSGSRLASWEATAVRAGADRARCRAVLVHLDGAVHDVQAQRLRHLYIRGHADAELHPVARISPPLLRSPQLGVAGLLQGGVERLGVLPGVVG